MGAMTYSKETPYGYIMDGKVFLKAYMHYPDREIGVVKQTEQEAIEYFEKRYETVKEKVEELRTMVEEAENKGSYLMKLLHMRTYLEEFKGLGDFPALFRALDEIEGQLRDLISVNREKNLQIKNQLVEEAEELSQSIDWDETALKFEELKLRWIKTGAVSEEFQKLLEDRFNQAIRTFFTNRKEFFKRRNKELKDRINHYKRIVERVSSLKNSNDFEKTAELFRELQNEWKTIGKIPQKKMMRMWDRFKKINNEFFHRYKQYKAGASIEQILPLDPLETAKVVQRVLTQKSEMLVGVNTDQSLAEAKQLLIQWKEKVNNPKWIDKSLAMRFRFACDRIFEEGYLMKVVRRKYPDFDKKPMLDQFRIKTSYLRELIRKEEQEINLVETGAYIPDNKNFNLATQKRKLSVKRVVLTEFEEALKTLNK